jgi:hypothetical protein
MVDADARKPGATIDRHRTAGMPRSAGADADIRPAA